MNIAKIIFIVGTMIFSQSGFADTENSQNLRSHLEAMNAHMADLVDIAEDLYKDSVHPRLGRGLNYFSKVTKDQKAAMKLIDRDAPEMRKNLPAIADRIKYNFQLGHHQVLASREYDRDYRPTGAAYQAALNRFMGAVSRLP